MKFDLPIRTCSKAKNKWGYSAREWKPGYVVRFLVFSTAKDAAFEANTGALFQDYLVKSTEGNRIGQIVLTLEQFDVGTLAHECFHAIFHWSNEYRPKDVTTLCAEEMIAYGLDRLVDDALEGFGKRGFTILAD